MIMIYMIKRAMIYKSVGSLKGPFQTQMWSDSMNEMTLANECPCEGYEDDEHSYQTDSR